MRGVKRSMSASWNELASTTTQSGCSSDAARSPTAQCRCCRPPVHRGPRAVSRCAISAVVVLLPFVPVTAITRQRQEPERELQLGDALHARERAGRCRTGAVGGMPGLTTTQVARAPAAQWSDRPARRRRPLHAARRAASRTPAYRRIRGVHVDARRQREQRCRAAAARDAEDPDAPARAHRIFSVLKASSCTTDPRIQKRTMILLSAQPAFSK